MSEDLDDWDDVPHDVTVAEAKDAIRTMEDAGALDDEALYHVHQREIEGQDRTTLTEWLNSRYDYDPAAEQVDTDDPADPADAAPARRGPPRTTDQPTLGDDEYDPNEHHAWAPGEVPTPSDIPLVAVRAERAGHIAGYHFRPDELKVVARNRRVDDAIVDGALDYRYDAPTHEDGETL